jgi:hypothetical protein
LRALDLQGAVNDRLTSYAPLMALLAGQGVYDHVPQGGDELFPYVVVGEAMVTPDDTDTSLGAQHALNLHAWARHRGRAEVKAIQDQIYDALHRVPLTVGDAVFVDGQFEMAQDFVDEDGLTRHGVQRFRFLLAGL